MTEKPKLSQRMVAYFGGVWTQDEENFVIEVEHLESQLAKFEENTKVVKPQKHDNVIIEMLTAFKYALLEAWQ